jgi:exopolysaccharide biosynthesis polyprenyl glycosylphosphotransferase
MLQRDRQIRTQFHQLADACLVALSFGTAYMLRANPDITFWLDLDPIPANYVYNINTILLAFALIPITPLVLESQGFYDRPVICTPGQILWPLFKGCLITTVGLILAGYVLHLNIPRWVPVWFGLISLTTIWLKEEVLQLAYKSKFAQLQIKRRFMLVGTKNVVAEMCKELEGRKDETIAVVAQFELGTGPITDLVHLLHDHAINGVILGAKHTYFDQVESVIKACELEGVEVWLLADFFATHLSRTTLDEFFGRPLLIFRTAPESSWPQLVKTAMDFCGALTALILSSWVFAIIAIAIKLTSPGPVFFKQQRSGLNGAPFTLIKFRTMITNAEQFKHELEAMNEMSGPVFKVTNDPRITPIGKFLRRYSLDELPQLWNVLRGEMSLVGPRPLPVDEVKRFNDFSHRRRLSVKPGITCLWQVKGRNKISDFKDWVRLDLEYIDHWSLQLDIKILFMTIPAVLRATGAK